MCISPPELRREMIYIETITSLEGEPVTVWVGSDRSHVWWVYSTLIFADPIAVNGQLFADGRVCLHYMAFNGFCLQRKSWPRSLSAR